MNMSNLLDIPFGTRFVGIWSSKTGNQFPVKSMKDITDIIDEHLGIDNIGISVCTFKDNKPYLLFLPFDLDAERLEDAWKDAIKLYNHFSKCGYDIHLNISGRRGFHIFLAVKPKTYSRQRLRAIQKYFKDKLGLKTLDNAIFGDIRRLMRIPFTYNINGGLCKVLYKQDGELVDLDNISLPETFEDYEVSGKDRYFHKYPCIEELVRHSPEPRHLIRYSYVLLRLAEDWSEDDIIKEIETFHWIDYDENYCRKQIRHIDAGNYNPLSCKSMKDFGYCKNECEYKPRYVDLKLIGLE